MMTANSYKQIDERRSLKSFFPIVSWVPTYNMSWLRGDVIAALTVWALLVPEAMAYAGIAGMPPQAGLYAAPLALLAYAIFGTSRQLNVGPSSTVAVMSAAVVSGMAISGSEEFIALTAMLALLTGVILILAGFLKLGVLADFLSKPVLAGFIVGLAISIAVGQLDKLLGYEVDSVDFVPDILVLIANFGQVRWLTLLVGAVSLAGLFAIDHYFPKVPGALTVVAISILLSALFNFEALGIHIVGDIPAGLPPIGLPSGLGFSDIVSLLPGALSIALVAFAESVAAARSYATKYGYEVDANQEMVALGVANVGAGMSQGFVVDGSLSKSAAADEAGAKSQTVSLIIAALVLITVLWLTPLFRTLPEATLGAIVIHAVWHLIDFAKLSRYRGIKSIDFWAAIMAMVGVLAFGILEGLILAVSLSLVGLLFHAKDPQTAILGKIPDENVYANIARFPEAETVPGLTIFRFDEQLFFANAANFRDEIRAIVAAAPETRAILVDAEAINDIDVTALDMLRDLQEELADQNIDINIARIRSQVKEYFSRADIEDRFDFYASIAAGVQAFQVEQDEANGTDDQESNPLHGEDVQTGHDPATQVGDDR